MGDYLLAAAAIFAVNLLPAFGPPTWAVLVFLHLNFGLEPAIVVPLGAMAAASGRYVLALGSRRLRGRFSAERIESLEAARAALEGSRAGTFAGIGLFALSPVPSAQLFIAAGLLAAPLVPLTLAFFAGRLVSYTLYVAAATVAADSIGEIVGDSLTSPLGIALQLAMLAGLVLLLRVDWAERLGTRGDRGPGAPASGATT